MKPVQDPPSGELAAIRRPAEIAGVVTDHGDSLVGTHAAFQSPGVAATLADAAPGISIGSKEDVADLVTKSSVNCTLLDIYSQGERIKEFSPTDKSVQEGVCNGQSLHWIRRVLQGGRAEYKVREVKANVARSPQAIDAKRKAQHMGGVATQKGTLSAELRKLSDNAYAAYSAEFDKLTEKRNSADMLFKKEMLELGATKTADGWSYIPSEKIQETWDKYETHIELIAAAKKELTDAKTAREAAGVYKHHWDEIGKTLDAKLLAVSAAKRKRPFSGIVALKTLNSQTFADGTSSFADKLLADPEFKVGTCALIGSGLLVGTGEAGGQISGHAVAVHSAKNNQIRIFDPNIGVFSCTSKGEMKAALAALIDVGWVKILGWQPDKKFGYSLFESGIQWSMSSLSSRPSNTPSAWKPRPFRTRPSSRLRRSHLRSRPSSQRVRRWSEIPSCSRSLRVRPRREARPASVPRRVAEDRWHCAMS